MRGGGGGVRKLEDGYEGRWGQRKKVLGKRFASGGYVMAAERNVLCEICVDRVCTHLRTWIVTSMYKISTANSSFKSHD